MRATSGWQSRNSSMALERVAIQRRDLRDDDIAVRIDYCGVCYSDLHAIHRTTDGVIVPGHEFTGTVTEVGPSVTGYTIGERVAVGTMVDSCGECSMCRIGQENYCSGHRTGTYGGTDRIDGSRTVGGYSREYVLKEKFAYALPEALEPAAAAPLMCAGVTVWEAMNVVGVGPSHRVAVAGLGGLGHLAVKFAVALGAEVTVLSHSRTKSTDARTLGARALVVTTDNDQITHARGQFDFIVDTISASHDLGPFMSLLRPGGTLCMVGLFWEIPVNIQDLMKGRKSLTASRTGGSKSTVEMLAFAAKSGIVADIELLPSARVGEALTRLQAGDVRYRFVLDLADLDYAG
jgi:uncharacterized zinc-type alcohol dehydrogenase-like protein